MSLFHSQTQQLMMIQPPWHFPVIFHVGKYAIYAHQITDLIAYVTGFRLYVLLRRREGTLGLEKGTWIFLGCVAGALLGSKILAWLEAAGYYLQLFGTQEFWGGGKTIVGGLLGGWLGIEFIKRIVHVRQSTGDACVFPLIIGMAIGRIGCFLTGLPDHTYGVETALPWGLDFGDHLSRHPTQIYEIIFLAALGAVLYKAKPSMLQSGALFRWFMLAYLGFRFLSEFIKPRMTILAGLSPIQWSCVIGCGVCGGALLKCYQRTVPYYG